MKLRKWLTKLNDTTRPPHLEGASGLTDQKKDAMATLAGAEMADLHGFGAGLAPTNWVPSQQDEAPGH